MAIKKTALGAVGLAATLLFTACSGGGGAEGKPSADTNGEGKTITVWVMEGDYTDETLGEINKRFTEETKAKVDLQVQTWDGINTKISTSLATRAVRPCR